MSAAEVCNVCGKVYPWGENGAVEAIRSVRDCCPHEPGMFVQCLCGERYSLHVHTVCPKCFRYPNRAIE